MHWPGVIGLPKQLKTRYDRNARMYFRKGIVMSLKLRLRTGERLAINGAVIRNASSRAVEIEILNEATLLHERDIMLPEQAVSPLHSLYLNLQIMHLEPEKFQVFHQAFVRQAAEIYAKAFSESDDETSTLVLDLIGFVGERNLIMAIKRLQSVIGKPGNKRKEESNE